MNWILLLSMVCVVLAAALVAVVLRGGGGLEAEDMDAMARSMQRPVQFPPWFAVVDVETTALDETLGSLVSIGAVVPATGDTFYARCWVREGALIQSDAMEVNGADWIEDQTLRTEGALVVAFTHWMGNRGVKLIGGKNPGFDLRWLKAAWKRSGQEGKYPLTHRTIDLHTLAWAWALRRVPHKLEGEGIKSDDLYVMMGLEPEPKPHNALKGAQVEAEAFAFLIVKGGVR